MSLLAELKRRNVIRMAGLYVVGAWLLVQVAGTVLPWFAVSASVLRGLVLVLVIGFVPALVFAWVFEMTPDGIRRDAEVTPEQSIAPQTAQRMNRLIVALLLLAATYFGFDKFVLAPKREAALVATTSQVLKAETLASAEATVSDKSIAVLPFVDMSQGKDQEYFSDGLSEELLNQLAQLPQLRVIARTSSFAFKGKEVGVADIARILKVGHVLEGSVRKSGNTLRITAQLIRASDSSHLWSQTYDRDLTDVFKVQDEISREVVSALKLELLPGKLPDSTQRTHSAAAYEQYLIGKNKVGGTRANAEASLAALQRAIAIDPGYANAYAALSFTQEQLADFSEDPAQRETHIAAALASADKAIALAPDLPNGYVRRGDLRFRVRWDWLGAQADLTRALELDPNKAGTLSVYAPMLFTLGRREQGLAMLRKALASDPLSANLWAVLARHLYMGAAGTRAEAKQAFERSREIDPQLLYVNFQLGNLLLGEGQIDEAIACYQRLPEHLKAAGMAMAEYTRGNEAASRQALAKLEKDFGIGFAFQIAQVHAWRGEKDQAFAALERAYQVHDAGMVRLPFDPGMNPLRDDPRFDELIRKMGFPE